MPDPLKMAGTEFARHKPATLLALGIALSFLDFLILYSAAATEGVLRVSGGVGLLNNYGLFSTLIGNALLLYLTKVYYDAVCSVRNSKAVVDSGPVEKALSRMQGRVEMQYADRKLLYFLVVVGALAWLSNTSSHLSGNYLIRWGSAVFDSPEYPLTFCASRLHNLYTWMLLMPFCGCVIVIISDELWKMVAECAQGGALKYDLLNPDQRGGFAFTDKAALVFSAIVLLAFLEITFHIETFKMNADHVMAYVFATGLFIGVNRLFFGGIYSAIKACRTDALNKLKDEVFQNDNLSFEILKYCYEQRAAASVVLSYVINPGLITISSILKLWPLVSQSFSGAL